MVNFNATLAGELARRQIGQEVAMNGTDPLHYSDRPQRETESDDVSTSFADVLTRALNRVNNLEIESNDLQQQMIHEPESVNIHTVMLAASKAEMALTFTKSIRDEAVRSFRELMNLR